MNASLSEITSDILPADLKSFLVVVDLFPEKSPLVWQQLAARLGERYTPERLEHLHASLCDYMGEPRTTMALNMRLLYEMPISREQFRGVPFMNLGYHASAGGPAIQPLEFAEGDRKYECNSALYRLWLQSSDIEGKDVIEVGSGRGGGASFLTRYFKPRSYTGVDGSQRQVGHCTDVHGGDAHKALKFVHGLAQDIPLADASADVVLNIESSHCYADLNKFLSEVHRVLKKGGTFILTDILFSKSLIFPYLDALDRYFHVRGKADITRNVLGCLEAHGPDQFFDQVRQGLDMAALNYLGSDAGGDVASHQSVNRDLLMMFARTYLPVVDTQHTNYKALSSSGEALYVSFRCEKKDI